MNKDEFKRDVLDIIKNYPDNWRLGQKVFNYIDIKYDVARAVQFEDGIDCFYNDEYIDPFIDACYKRL